MSTGTSNLSPPAIRETPARPALLDRYHEVRSVTEHLCADLQVEDFVAQSMPNASPVKWHLAHTTWFFETFVLRPGQADHQPFDARYGYLFNSYYNAVGARIPRPERGLLTRPTVDEVFRYRRHVDAGITELLESGREGGDLVDVIELGLHHEQQHQELLLTDLKHLFAFNPLRPVFRAAAESDTVAEVPPCAWRSREPSLSWIGHAGEAFAYDNERPRHRVYVDSFRLASRLVTNGEYLEFMSAGGYSRPEWWLSDGWDACTVQGWSSPLYWEKQDGQWRVITLSGLRALNPSEPVCHVSLYEAAAYAAWIGARLPTEAEWETAAADTPLEGNFLEQERFHPQSLPMRGDSAPPELQQLFGDVWEWTASPYGPYPGYRAAPGALGEYNGKFMCNQFVLRGGSCITPRTHIRRTYRNFFPPDARWQFTGIRLAGDL